MYPHSLLYAKQHNLQARQLLDPQLDPGQLYARISVEMLRRLVRCLNKCLQLLNQILVKKGFSVGATYVRLMLLVSETPRGVAWAFMLTSTLARRCIRLQQHC